MKDSKICIYINAYTVNNLGDDMFIHALCKHYPMIDFYVEMSSKYRQPFSELTNLTILTNDMGSYHEFLIKIIDFQVLIGGSLFMEPKLINDIEKKFHKRVSCRLSANIPFFVIGANFGNFTQDKFYNQYKKWFKSLDGICFRDSQSYTLFKELDNVLWAPDLLFSYAMPEVKSTTNNIVISPIYNNGRTGLADFDNIEYISFLVDISQRYIEMGFNIILASFCSEQLDDISCQKIFESIPETYKKNVKIIYYKNDINSFLNEFTNSKYVIGSRFHSIILSLKSNIPVFPIVYNIKSKNIIECYNFEGNYIDIQNLCSIDFEFIDSNRNKNCISNLSSFEKYSHLHYYFLNEAIIEKMQGGSVYYGK